MKQALLLPALLILACASFCQTNILDSTINWDAPGAQGGTLQVFLSDSAGLNSIHVKLGSEYDSSDVFLSDYTVGSTINITDNTMQVPLTNVTEGEYYVAIIITRDDLSTQAMQYKIQ